jgi:hypothetical protein
MRCGNMPKIYKLRTSYNASITRIVPHRLTSLGPSLNLIYRDAKCGLCDVYKS